MIYKDILYLEFPTHKEINHPYENRLYYGESKEAKDYFKYLLKEYKYYCPYCGSDISKGVTLGIDGDFEREHTIEKNQSGIEYEHLIQCKFNLCISCSKCNKNKKANMIPVSDEFLNHFHYKEMCTTQSCSEKCVLYTNSLKDYLNKNKFMIQPYGTYNTVTKNKHRIHYNVKERKFIPFINENYSDEDVIFIEAHIKKLKLNIHKPEALRKIVGDLRWIFKYLEKGKKIDVDFLESKKENLDNILDVLFLEYFVTLDYRAQYFLIDELYSEYNK